MADLETIEEYMNRRTFTDYIMPIWLPFIPILLVIIGFLSFLLLILINPPSTTHHYSPSLYPPSHPPSQPLFTSLGLAIVVLMLVLVLVGLVVNIYVVYKWVSRRNDHFKRQRLLFKAISDYLKSKLAKKSESQLSYLNRLNTILNEIETEEEEKNAVLWALIQFVPYIGGILLLYVYHFLNKDFWRHERREDQFLDVVSSILGVNFYHEKMESIPNRNTVLYIVLSLITLGFFGLYWVYTLTKDPNEHFKRHVNWESRLLDALRSFD